ncbi:MAG: hypothetical protein HY428_01645 [Candidatus Levybacteria bacterium]|nr:hypothetical protein [Candidatus Levybacteria bacterium]
MSVVENVEARAALGVHPYQPMRRVNHAELRQVDTDPQRFDWTANIFERCYLELAQRGIFSEVPFSWYPTLTSHELPRVAEANPDLKDAVTVTTEIMRGNLAENGVGAPYIHALLPDLTQIDKRVVIAAGRKQFVRDSGGVSPQHFWGAEGAYDYKTLSALAAEGYRGFVCAPEQIALLSGGSPDNKPALIRLPNRRKIIALPFDNQLAREIGLGDKSNADRFADDIVRPALWHRGHRGADAKPTVISWTDAEAFNGHEGTARDAHLFVDYLLHEALPNRHIEPISINEIPLDGDLPEARLHERTAWSCSHGDLARWHGGCNCGNNGEADKSWKQPFSAGHHELNKQITTVLRRETGLTDRELIERLSDGFGGYLRNPGGAQSNPLDSLYSAKVSGIAGETSCGTFFDDPGPSGRINILFALQAILHLRDAGFLGDADKIEGTYMRAMSEVVDPYHPEITGVAIVEELFAQKYSGVQEHIVYAA